MDAARVADPRSSRQHGSVKKIPGGAAPPQPREAHAQKKRVDADAAKVKADLHQIGARMEALQASARAELPELQQRLVEIYKQFQSGKIEDYWLYVISIGLFGLAILRDREVPA